MQGAGIGSPQCSTPRAMDALYSPAAEASRLKDLGDDDRVIAQLFCFAFRRGQKRQLFRHGAEQAEAISVKFIVFDRFILRRRRQKVPADGRGHLIPGIVAFEHIDGILKGGSLAEIV